LWKKYKDSEDASPLFKALDYAAQSAWRMNFREKLQDFFQLNDEAADNVVENMRQNLHRGALKFVVLMDSIDERLKDLITFVNQKSDFSVYAVQLEYYKDEDREIVIPKLYGAEARREKSQSAGSRRTNLAEGVMEILRDGEWHTGPDLRRSLDTPAITAVLKSLHEAGKVELEASGRGHRVRLPRGK
jgi:hypothetical protein